MNPLIKKAMYAGIGLAVVAKERVELVVEDLIKKGQAYQGEHSEEEPIVNVEEPKAETSEEEGSKFSRLEEYEQKLRKLVDSAVAKLNFSRNSDEHERIEKRIEALEEKLSKLAQSSMAFSAEEETAERI